MVAGGDSGIVDVSLVAPASASPAAAAVAFADLVRAGCVFEPKSDAIAAWVGGWRGGADPTQTTRPSGPSLAVFADQWNTRFTATVSVPAQPTSTPSGS